jgi:hypothetical protein
MSTLQASTIPIDRIDAATRKSMWELFSAYYEQVDPARFDSDLLSKKHVILLRAVADRSVQGFSTITSFDRKVQGRRVVGVFSGDTIVAKEHWNQTVLQRAFLRYVMQVKLAHPLLPVYWFLISKGYRTYLLLARNFPEYWPRCDAPTPTWQAAVLDDFARSRFDGAWHPDLGVLKFARCPGRLRSEVAAVDERARRLAEVRFFEERNPGHAQGDELCCLGRVDARLWGSYMLKLARKAARRGSR